LRKYVAWALDTKHMSDRDAATVRQAVEGFEVKVRRELASLTSTLDSVRLRGDAVEVFGLDQEMVERAVDLGASDLNLEPYDQAVLAAVLVRASRLRDQGELDVCFCERDRDLQPWAERGNAKQPLARLYDEAHVWVYGDFELESPERPADWPPP
jgi:hypothetical protein